MRYRIAGIFNFEGSVVEKREQLIVFPLSKRVILVVVTLAAFECCSKPNCSGRIDSIDDLVDTVFFWVHAGFYVTCCQSMETGGCFLPARVAAQ